MLDSSLPEEEELEEPEPLEVEPVEDSVLVDGVVVVVEDSVPVEVPDDSALVEVPLDVEEEEACFVACFADAAFFAAALLAAALLALVPLEFDVLATTMVEAVVFLLESAGSCPEASWT